MSTLHVQRHSSMSPTPMTVARENSTVKTPLGYRSPQESRVSLKLVVSAHKGNKNSGINKSEIRKPSTIGRANFLESFGQDNLYGYSGYEHSKREFSPTVTRELPIIELPTLMEVAQLSKNHVARPRSSDIYNRTNDTEQVLRRVGSASRTQGLKGNRMGDSDFHENIPSVCKSESLTNGSTSEAEGSKRSPQQLVKGGLNPKKKGRDLLSLRGKDYSIEGSSHLDIVSMLRQKSAKRRIKRIMEAERIRLERERERMQQSTKHFTFRGVAKGIRVWQVATGVGHILDRRRALARQNRYLARIRFRRACRFAVLVFHWARTMAEYSANLAPRTAAQTSWYALRHSEEAKEILFNKALFVKGKSQYAYVPDRAKRIMMKLPMDRTDSELSQLHAMLKGLQAYDKFTYRIQIALCRAMTYTKVEHPRVIIRKGHVGIGFYFIFSGSVFVNVEELLLSSGETNWHTSIILSRGDSFGELALLRKIRRTASVVVREDVELLVVDKQVFAETCPKIYDKELEDKIAFCKSLKLFQPWSDNALRNICFEAQIQEWKANKIIVNDTNKETEWIYLCMQGECSVIKALELNPNKSVFKRKRTLSFIEDFGVIPQRGNRNKADVGNSERWKKDLEKSFKGMFNFANKDKKVDEFGSESGYLNCSDSEDEYEDSDDEVEQDLKEKILDAMDLSYANLPHCRGDTDYVELEEVRYEHLGAPVECARRPSLQVEPERRVSDPTFLSLMRRKESTGKLNNDVVFLKIAHMKRGDVFDMSEVLKPTGRQMMLVSLGAITLRVRKTDFFRYATKGNLQHAKKISHKADYPSNTALYRSYNERCAWEAHKAKIMKATLQDISDACVRHKDDLNTAPVKKPMKQSSVYQGKETADQERRRKFNEHLQFAYGRHKARACMKSPISVAGEDHVKPTLTRMTSILKVRVDGERRDSVTAKQVSFTPTDEESAAEEKRT